MKYKYLIRWINMLVVRTFMLDMRSVEILKKIKESLGISQSEALRLLINMHGEELLNSHDDQMQVPAP